MTSNLDPDGKLMAANDPRLICRIGQRNWHSDSSFTYLHHWQAGDLVMYDNCAVLHRARPYAITGHARVLHRTTVAGDGPIVH